MKRRPIRRAGSRWRILAWAMGPDGKSGKGYSVGSVVAANADSDERRDLALPGTDLDEVVIGSFFHLEQMDTGLWWISIGGVTVHVKADRDGKPIRVTVDGPNDYDEPVPGCRYELRWSGEDVFTGPDPLS